MHVHSHSNSQSHDRHHHVQAGQGSDTVLKWSLAATLIFVCVQVGAGLTAGSLALISDAGHNFTDALALGLALFGVYLRRKPADESRTFGYHRGGVLAAFVNALSLVLLSLFVFHEAWERLWKPQPVEEFTMIAVAGLGIVLNVGIMLGLKAHSSDVNIRAAFVHMLGDALGSVAIIIGAVVIRNTGWYVIDPLLSILIGALIVWSSWDVIRESLNILLEGMPRGIELKNVTEAIRSVPGVLDVHDLHVWSLGSGAHALSCHALIEDMPPSESDCILRGITHALGDDFNIHHSTIQFEHTRCAVTGSGCSMDSRCGQPC
ncbi:MAG: cation diffusion facilitator family transporter [Bryobacteraceae bacterium]|nr:cation diffusion facilitator family transporter [Bryobacteraceae bacterium]